MLTNSLSFKRVSHLFAVIAVTASLGACGGGGGSEAPATGPAVDPVSVPSGSGPSSPAPAQLAKYQGSWKSFCETYGGGSTFNKLSIDASAKIIPSYEYFTSSDCSGSPVTVITDLPVLLTAQGTKTIASATVDKADAFVPAATPNFSGFASVGQCGGFPNAMLIRLSANGPVIECIEIPPADRMFKLVLSLTQNGTQLIFGNSDDSAPKDADGYPNTLEFDTYIKQASGS